MKWEVVRFTGYGASGERFVRLTHALREIDRLEKIGEFALILPSVGDTLFSPIAETAHVESPRYA